MNVDALNFVQPLSALAEAENLIRGARDKDYGNFAVEARKIEAIYSFLKMALEPIATEGLALMRKDARDHALYMMVVKLVRESHRHKRDNIVDLMGYAQLYLDNCEGPDGV